MVKKKLTVEDALVPKEEIPYEVPENWLSVKLTSIFKFEKGKKPKLLLDEFEENTIPYVTINYFQTKEAKQYTYETETNRICADDDILIVWDGARAGLVGMGVSGALGSTLCKIKFKGLNHKFVYYYFVGKYDEINKNTKGTGIPHVDPSYLETLIFNVPPLAEQERIVNRIESLFDKVDKAAGLVEEAREGFEKRRAAILERAFCGELTKKWREENGVEFTEEKIPLSEVVNVNPKKPKLEVDDEQICSFVPMVAVSDVNGKIEAMEERPYVKVKKGYTYFEEGDVLFAKITPCMENGKSCIAEGLSNGFGFGTTEFHVLRCGEKVLNKYVYYLVRAKWFREEAKQHMTGAVGQQRVPKTYLEDYEVWIPSIEEQEEVVRLLEYMLDKEFEIEGLCDIDDKAELLKKSILGRAFRGELGSNDLDEESSVENIKNIIM